MIERRNLRFGDSGRQIPSAAASHLPKETRLRSAANRARAVDDPQDAARANRAELAIVGCAMRGDGEAIRMLWEQHRRWIAAVVLAHKPAFEDLEDLLQEVAVTFVTKVSTLREEAHLRAWLRTVAINTARAAGRARKYRPRPELPEDDAMPATATDFREQLAGAEQTRRLMLRVSQLPEAYREPLMLRAMNGMRSKQIADVLGIPPATVDTRIARARRMLREVDENPVSTNGVFRGETLQPAR